MEMSMVTVLGDRLALYLENTMDEMSVLKRD